MKGASLLTLSLSLMFLLMGCESSVQSNINQTNNSIADDLKMSEGKELTLVFEESDSEAIQIEIEKLPVLMSYLTQNDKPELEMDRFQSTYIHTHQQKDYFLISYNCGVKLCDQLLVEHSQDGINSIEVSNSSFLQDAKQQEDYLALLFGRNEGTEVVRNQIAVFNLKEFEKVLPPNQLEVLESFDYPISRIEWEGKDLRVNIANIKELTYENIKKWNDNKKNLFVSCCGNSNSQLKPVVLDF